MEIRGFNFVESAPIEGGSAGEVKGNSGEVDSSVNAVANPVLKGFNDCKKLVECHRSKVRAPEKSFFYPLKKIIPGLENKHMIQICDPLQTRFHHKLWKKVFFRPESFQKMSEVILGLSKELKPDFFNGIHGFDFVSDFSVRVSLSSALRFFSGRLDAKDIAFLQGMDLYDMNKIVDLINPVFDREYDSATGICCDLKAFIKKEGNEDFPSEEDKKLLVKSSLFSFLFACGINGSKALSSSIEFCLENPQVISEAMAEIEELKKDHRELFSVFRSSKTLEKIFVESIRMRPVVSHINRKEMVVIFPYAEEEALVGDNPKIFNIHRHDSMPASNLMLKWIPFGKGPNVCPGGSAAEALVVQTLGILMDEGRLLECALKKKNNAF